MSLNDTRPKSSGSYRPPRLRGSGAPSRNSKSLAASTNVQSLTSTKEELEKRRERFAKDKLKKSDLDFGLISRGEDNRLQRDPEARIAYFKKIQNEFAETFSSDDIGSLRQMMAGLSLEGKTKNEKFDQILLSLRKLRESLLKFKADDFAKSVFLFSIRTSARVGHYQTYIPSITYLLRNTSILTPEELDEVVCYYCLHLSHFNRNDQLALETYFKYSKGNLWLEQVLRSWRNLEYKKWFQVFSAEKDASKHKIMEFGKDRMVSHTIRCLQKSYFQLPKSYVREIFQEETENLIKRFDCSWTLTETTVIIRSRTA